MTDRVSEARAALIKQLTLANVPFAAATEEAIESLCRALIAESSPCPKCHDTGLYCLRAEHATQANMPTAVLDYCDCAAGKRRRAESQPPAAVAPGQAAGDPGDIEVIANRAYWKAYGENVMPVNHGHAHLRGVVGAFNAGKAAGWRERHVQIFESPLSEPACSECAGLGKIRRGDGGWLRCDGCFGTGRSPEGTPKEATGVTCSRCGGTCVIELPGGAFRGCPDCKFPTKELTPGGEGKAK